MKIRAGFVSNSSSASYIVPRSEEFPNVFAVAKKMLEVRNEDGWGESQESENIAKALNLGVHPNTAISFKTCNYDTYIFIYDNNLYISTCNNHPFYELLNGHYVGEGHDSGEFQEIENKIAFWYPERDTVVKSYSPRKPCTKKEHLDYNWVTLDGIPVCLDCVKENSTGGQPRIQLLLTALNKTKRDFLIFRG